MFHVLKKVVRTLAMCEPTNARFKEQNESKIASKVARNGRQKPLGRPLDDVFEEHVFG